MTNAVAAVFATEKGKYVSVFICTYLPIKSVSVSYAIHIFCIVDASVLVDSIT